MPSPSEIRDALADVLQSQPFATATRAKRFLTYVVEETLAGRDGAIKELVLGSEVCDRPADFDPRTDTIVRVEAVKLRKRLAEYYAGQGRSARIRIALPKGSYVPQFELMVLDPAAVRAPSPSRGRWYALAAAGILAVAVATSLIVARRPVPSSPGVESIAVLPFLNLSPDPTNEYFADGLAEELTDALARIPNLRVASRTSAFFYKGRPVDLHDVGANLHVMAVVEGSVRKEGDRLRITAQIVRTDDGYHVWSQTFERGLNDVFSVQQEVAAAVASSTPAALRTHATATAPRTANVEAFDLYLRGIAIMFVRPDEAKRLLLRAVAVDPMYARPYLALSRLYILDTISGVRPTAELVAKARAALDRNIALDGRSAESYAVLASLAARHDYDWASAHRDIQEALRLDPHSGAAYYALAQDILAPQGRFDEAEAAFARASELDPLSGQIAIGGPWLSFLRGDYARAVQGFTAIRDAGPNPMALLGLAAAETARRDYGPALASFRAMQQTVDSPQTLGMIGFVQGRIGRRDDAARVLAELRRTAGQRFVSPIALAMASLGVDDRPLALDYLEQARAGKESALIFLRSNTAYDPLRSDQRFLRLQQAIGLSDEQIRARQVEFPPDHR